MGKLSTIDKKHFEPAEVKTYDFNAIASKAKTTKSSKFANPLSKRKKGTTVDESSDSFVDDDTDILNNDEVNIDPIKYNKGLNRKKNN